MAEASVTISERAARRIGEILKSEGDGAMLRISVEGGGCSGFQYKFDVERAQADDDLVIARDSAVVLVDPASVPFLTGSEVDFVDDLIGASFRVVNPNATASCGCGTSFFYLSRHDLDGQRPHPHAIRFNYREISRPIRPTTDKIGEKGADFGGCRHRNTKQYNPANSRKAGAAGDVAKVLVERQNNAALASSPPKDLGVRRPRRDRCYPDDVMSCAQESIDRRSWKILVCEKAHVTLLERPFRNAAGRARSLNRLRYPPATSRDNSRECLARSSRQPSSQSRIRRTAAYRG